MLNDLKIIKKTYENIPSQDSNIGYFKLTTFIVESLDGQEIYKVFGIGDDEWVLKNGCFIAIGG